MRGEGQELVNVIALLCRRTLSTLQSSGENWNSSSFCEVNASVEGMRQQNSIRSFPSLMCCIYFSVVCTHALIPVVFPSAGSKFEGKPNLEEDLIPFHSPLTFTSHVSFTLSFGR